MKKTIILILSATLALCSCDKALERYPLNGPSTGTFPASEEEALSGVLVSYKNLANSEQQYCNFPTRFTDNITDIGTTRVGLSSWNLFVTSTLTQTTSAATYLYGRIYKTAGRIHLVLDKLRRPTCSSKQNCSASAHTSTIWAASSTVTFPSSTIA